MSDSEKWANQVKAFLESGKSQRVWSAEHGIKRSTLRYWLERTEKLSEGSEVRFAQLVIGGESCADDQTG